MIKLLDLLNEMEYPKGRYIQVTDSSELKDIQNQLFDLVQNAYSSIGGHVNIGSPSDILDPDITYWRVADIDADPELDVVTFGKRRKQGVKHTGMGHDGDKANIKNLLRHKSDLLKTSGNYIEVSGPAFRAFVEIGGVPTVDDEETVRDILRGKEIEWHGEHPTDSSKPGKGWYTRELGGSKHTKIMAGVPA